MTAPLRRRSAAACTSVRAKRAGIRWLSSPTRVYANYCSLPCVQGRVGVGLHALAAQLEFNARLRDPTLALPYFAGEGTDCDKRRLHVIARKAPRGDQALAFLLAAFFAVAFLAAVFFTAAFSAG